MLEGNDICDDRRKQEYQDRLPRCLPLSNRYEVVEPELSGGEIELLKELKTQLYESVTVDLPTEDRDAYLRSIVDSFLSDYEITLDPASINKLMYYVIRDSLGYGKLDPVMRDWKVEDISGDGPDIPVYVYHRKYHSLPTNIVFSKDEMDAMVLSLAQKSDRHISFASPLLDATLPQGSRLQASIGSEVTTHGSTFTIRMFRSEPMTPINLIDYNTYSPEMMAYLWLAVENGKSIIIAGGTASGKTSTLNAICLFIPPKSKIVSIEDTRELNIRHENWIPDVTREREEGGKSIDMYALLRTALRQRPEYLLVGEVRGKEAYTLFQAMASGHITYSTIHADSTEAVVRRLINPPIDVPMMLLEGIDIICVQGMVKVGTTKVRRGRQINEATGVDIANERLIFNDLFIYNPAQDSFEFTGESNVFAELMDTLNMSEEELSEEFGRRVEVLEWMKKEHMDSFDEFADMVVSYYREPEKVMERVRRSQIEKERGVPRTDEF